jgi:hypothetical protein
MNLSQEHLTLSLVALFLYLTILTILNWVIFRFYYNKNKATTEDDFRNSIQNQFYNIERIWNYWTADGSMLSKVMGMFAIAAPYAISGAVTAGCVYFYYTNKLKKQRAESIAQYTNLLQTVPTTMNYGPALVGSQ